MIEYVKATTRFCIENSCLLMTTFSFVILSTALPYFFYVTIPHIQDYFDEEQHHVKATCTNITIIYQGKYQSNQDTSLKRKTDWRLTRLSKKKLAACRQISHIGSSNRRAQSRHIQKDTYSGKLSKRSGKKVKGQGKKCNISILNLFSEVKVKGHRSRSQDQD